MDLLEFRMEGTVKGWGAQLVVAAAVMLIASVVFAAESEIFILKARNGDVTFNHTLHQDGLGDCAPCHGDTDPGKIENFSKKFGHWEDGGGLCKGCHQKMDVGPSACPDCHQKKKKGGPK